MSLFDSNGRENIHLRAAWCRCEQSKGQLQFKILNTNIGSFKVSIEFFKYSMFVVSFILESASPNVSLMQTNHQSAVAYCVAFYKLINAYIFFNRVGLISNLLCINACIHDLMSNHMLLLFTHTVIYICNNWINVSHYELLSHIVQLVLKPEVQESGGKSSKLYCIAE